MVLRLLQQQTVRTMSGALALGAALFAGRLAARPDDLHVLAVAAGMSAGGAIRGRVEIRRVFPPIAHRPSPSSIGSDTVTPKPERRPAVVYVETASPGAFERDEARAVMDQRGETFVPHVLAITVGTTVDFPNSDPFFHNVFSLSRTRPFDLGRYARGQSKSVRFDRPGVVQVFCDIHSHMSAYILVFAHRYFAVTDAGGRYWIDRVPPGSYTVAVWYEGSVRERRSVMLRDDGDVMDADFIVR
jgi:plastocyanin